MISIVVILICGLFCVYQRQGIMTRELPYKTGARIIIYARYRTGSSFTGELFQQNPDVFFAFEPLKFLSFGGQSFVNQGAEAALKLVLSCQFQTILDVGHNISDNRILKFWKYRAFCSKLVMQEAIALCKKYTVKMLEQLCASQPHVAAKIIHVSNIGPLVNLMMKGVKVVHLVRDPRGVMSSRLKVMENDIQTKKRDVFIIDVQKDSIKYCQEIVEDLEYLHTLFLLYPSLKSNYYILRYEDLAENPINKSQEIYSFLGIGRYDQVQEWINNSTHTDDSDLKKRIPKTGSLFSTQRKSSSAMQGWRSHLSYKTVTQIQNLCLEAMGSLGYVPVSSEKHLTENNVSLLEELPRKTLKHIRLKR